MGSLKLMDIDPSHMEKEMPPTIVIVQESNPVSIICYRTYAVEGVVCVGGLRPPTQTNIPSDLRNSYVIWN
jgi:hypothetical protein